MPGLAGGNWSIYEREKEDGAGDRSRTYDLRITNALLYQLSYTGVRRRILGRTSRDGNNDACALFRNVLPSLAV